MMRAVCVGLSVALAAGLAACSGDSGSPTAPSLLPGTGATSISGTASTGSGPAASALRAPSSGPAFGALDSHTGGLRVCVVGTGVCVDIEESGTFTLSGDFAGDVVLHFKGQGQNVRVTVQNVQPGEAITVRVALNGDNGTLDVESRENGAAGPKVDVCHLTGNGSYRLIQIDEHAQDAHLAHGDGLPGEPLPDGSGRIFGDDCSVLGPAIDIEKSTNGRDADSAPGRRVEVGSSVEWTYVVTNTGDMTLTEVAVVDSEEGAADCPSDTLAPGESMTCALSGLAILGQYSNTGLVTADTDAGEVSDSDDSHYFGEEADDDPEGDTEKVELCHRRGNGDFHLIEVSVDAMPAHLAHGDGIPGEDGFAADCTVTAVE